MFCKIHLRAEAPELSFAIRVIVCMQEINGSLNTGPNIASDPLYHDSLAEYEAWLKKLNMIDLQKHYVVQTNQPPQGDRKNIEAKLKRQFIKNGN